MKKAELNKEVGALKAQALSLALIALLAFASANTAFAQTQKQVAKKTKQQKQTFSGSTQSATTQSASTIAQVEVAPATSALTGAAPGAPNASVLQTNTANIADVTGPTSGKKVGFIFDLSAASSLQREGDVSRSAENVLTFIPSYQLSERLSIAALTLVTQELTGERNTMLSNIKLRLTHRPLELNSQLTLVPSFVGTLPTNTIANKDNSFQGAVGASGKLLFNPGWKYAASASYTASLERNIHEFTLNDEGSPNLRYGLVNTIGLSLPLIKRFTLAINGSLISGWTYRGTAKSKFDLSESIAFQASQAWSLYVGHSNAGSTMKANGHESNIAVFNNRTSVISAGTSYVF